MKKLKMPDDEELEKIIKAMELNSEEKRYLENIEKTRDVLFSENDHKNIVEFYNNKLKSITNERKFNNRIAIKRRLEYLIGYSYEMIGILEDDIKPLERAKIFEDAAFWYHKTDETIGFLTDYVTIRKGNSLISASVYRKKAGLDDIKTKMLRNLGEELIKKVFGSGIILADRNQGKILKQMAYKKEGREIDTYTINLKDFLKKSKNSKLN